MELLDQALSKKIVIVTGKGGVGKSLLSLTFSEQEARKGKKVLLVELGENSYFESYFSNFNSEIKGISYQPKAVKLLDDSVGKLSVSLLGGVNALKDYVEELVKLKPLVDLFFSNKVIKTFLQAAPTLSDISILGKITSGVRSFGKQMDYDLIVVDAYSTGHFMTMLKTPFGLYETMPFGPMGKQCNAIIEVLSNPQLCKIIIATLPEELPLEESIELAKDVEKICGQKALLVLNQVFPIEIETALEGLLEEKFSEEGLLEKDLPEELKIENPEFVEQIKNKVEKCKSAKQKIIGASYQFISIPQVLKENKLNKLLLALSAEEPK